MDQNDWQLNLSRFRHDWLKNKFIQRVGALTNAANGSVLIDNFEISLRSLINEWENNSNDIIYLIKTYSEKMSPKVLFLKEPLLKMKKEDKKILVQIIHERWISKYNINGVIESAMTLMEMINNSISCLNSVISDNSQKKIDMAALGKQLFTIHCACLELSSIMDQLPKQIRP